MNVFRTIVKGCRGKHRHASHGAAEAHVRALQRADDRAGRAESIYATYWCFACQGWHVRTVR
jgi:hypothetical protein